MTLIITELSRLGIIMVGETAQTVTSIAPNHTVQDRSFFGLVKVIPVPKLQAGLSYWGWAKIPPDDEEHGIWLDWWLQDLIQRQATEYETLEDLANLLETDMRLVVPRMTETELRECPGGNIGVHLAGFIETDGNKLPCLWHIHNGRSERLPDKQLDPYVINANYDLPPHRFDNGRAEITRNGDIEAYIRFFDRHLRGYIEELQHELGIIVPYPTLGSRAEFWSAQIKFISALYEVSGYVGREGLLRMIKGIGDQVTTLTITESGIVSYFTR